MKLVTLALGLGLALAPVAQTAVAQLRETPLVIVDDPQVFSDMALSSAMYGIISSEIALERSQDAEVRAFAETMVTEKTEATAQLIEAAKADAVTPAAGMSPRHLADVDTLKKSSAEDFDDSYLSAQGRAHDEAVTLFQGFAAEGQPGALRDFAAEAVEGLAQHQADLRGLSAN